MIKSWKLPYSQTRDLELSDCHDMYGSAQAHQCFGIRLPKTSFAKSSSCFSQEFSGEIFDAEQSLSGNSFHFGEFESWAMPFAHVLSVERFTFTNLYARLAEAFNT